MNLLFDPDSRPDDPALSLRSDEDIERFRAYAKLLDGGDGSLIWRAWATIIRARFRIAREREDDL